MSPCSSSSSWMTPTPLKNNESAFLADLEDPKTEGTPKYFKSVDDLDDSVRESIQYALKSGVVADRKGHLSSEGEVRGKSRVAKDTDHGLLVQENAGSKIRSRTPDEANHLPKNPRRRKFVGRSAEKAELMQAIDTVELIGVIGPPGVGKKALLKEVTWTENLDADFADGAAVHPQGAETANLEDLLQAIWEEYYETDDPSDVRPRERDHQLSQKQTLIFLPDTKLDPDQIEKLVERMPDAVFCITGEDPRVRGSVVTIAGFSDPDEVLEIFESRYHATVPDETRPDILALCRLLGGSPGRVDLLASRAGTEARYTPGHSGEHPLTSWAAAKRSMTGDELWKWLVPANQQRAVAAAQATGGHTPGPVMTHVGGSKASVDRAVDNGLLEKGSPRYRANSALAEADGTNDATIMSAIFASALAWAEEAGPTEIYDDRAFVLRMLDWAAEQERWEDALKLGMATEAPMALGGRHGAWERVLDHCRNAAVRMEPPNEAAQAWALHQLGSRAMLRDELGDARILLHEALRRRPEGNDEAQAITRNNLGLLPAAIVSGGVLLLLLVFLVTSVPPLLLGGAPFEPDLDVTFTGVAAPATYPTEGATEPLDTFAGDRAVVMITAETHGPDGERLAAGDPGFCIVADGIVADDVCESGASRTGAAAAETACTIEVQDNTLEAVLPGGEPCILEIGFQPLAADTYEATLSLQLKSDGSEYEGTLRGEATPALLMSEVDREIAHFKIVGDRQRFRIENVGTESFWISQIQSPPRIRYRRRPMLGKAPRPEGPAV